MARSTYRFDVMCAGSVGLYGVFDGEDVSSGSMLGTGGVAISSP
jgi:hypothetical protein